MYGDLYYIWNSGKRTVMSAIPSETTIWHAKRELSARSGLSPSIAVSWESGAGKSPDTSTKQ